MGLMKIEHQDVQYNRYANNVFQNNYGQSNTAHSNELAHDDDEEVTQVLQTQRIQVYEATLQLKRLDKEHHEKESRSTETSKGSAIGSTKEPLIKRVAKSIASAPHNQSLNGENCEPIIRLPFEKILKLLLSSIQGNFESGIPKQKCASPVPISSQGGYQPMFYVSKEKMVKTDETLDGIPVRYQGFTKSTVWFSKENPRFGLAARRMQHQSRMKQTIKNDNSYVGAHNHNNDVESMASKAALFFHVFEGFSYVLIQRNDPNEDISKSSLANHIVDRAAKFVQIWPISKNGVVVSGSSMKGQKQIVPVPLQKSQSAINLSNFRKMGLDRQRSMGSKRSLVDFEAEHEALDSPKRTHYDNNKGKEPTLNESKSSDNYNNNNVGRGEQSAGNFDFNIFDCDSLLEEALLSGEEDYASATSSENSASLQDFLLEETQNDGFGYSTDPHGMVLCDIIYKSFCERMLPGQFARECSRINSLLFNPKFAQSLRTAIDNKDPRLAIEFMYPFTNPSTAKFAPNAPIGKLVMSERFPKTNEFVVQSCDNVTKQILKIDPSGMVNLFDALDNTDMSFVMSKYYWVEHFKSDNLNRYWIQRFITLGNGRRAVVRAFIVVNEDSIVKQEQQGATQRNSSKLSVSIQDVSHLYQNLLQLPPTCLYKTQYFN